MISIATGALLGHHSVPNSSSKTPGEESVVDGLVWGSIPHGKSDLLIRAARGLRFLVD
jgi:hypothetical protein